MKKLLAAAVVLTVVCLPMASFAAVSGTDHDMTSYTYGGTLPADADLCQACHIPHKAVGDRLWASDTAGTGYIGVARLCATCHDGDIAPSGPIGTPAANQHMALSGDCSGADESSTSSCHDVHNEGGDFFMTNGTTNGSGCETCHGGTAFVDAAGGSTAPGSHAGSGNHTTSGGIGCNTCHSAHSPEAQTGGSGFVPFLVGDNSPSGEAWGAMCIECHDENSTADIFASGDFATDRNEYYQTTIDGTETSHPTWGTGWSTNMTGCDACHTPHGANTDTDLLLTVLHNDATNQNMCLTCHTESAVVLGPAIGGTHPVDGAADVTGFTNDEYTPWAAEITDKDATAAFDYPNANGNRMVCETCHSMHKVGTATNFTRVLVDETDALCVTCHTAN